VVAVIGDGDGDGDGTDDLAVAAPEWAAVDGVPASGRVYVALGGLALPEDASLADAHLVLSGASGDRAGADLAGGDLDADRVADLAVGVPGSDLGGDAAGRVDWLGGPVLAGGGHVDLATGADIRWTGTRGQGLGEAVTHVADLDGDGTTELAVAGSEPDGSDVAVLLVQIPE
jgi:hypothetical protein